MVNQDSPKWETLGMDHDLSPPWTLLNIVKALNLRLLIIPPKHRSIKEGRALLMVNNRATYPDTPKGTQLVFIPTTRADNHEVTTIIEESTYNCTYVYVRTTTPYYLGCVSVSSTKYTQHQLRHT